MEQRIDITPSPRVLRMLGEIDFKPWQCLAELIDNSIDSFLDQINQGVPNPSPRVTIDLPNDNALINGQGQVVVKDNGTGMTLDQLQHAVQAGYSGNNPVDKMGLFGMGFNISTARLGRRTEVWTTTSESTDWIGVEIDFDKLEREGTFKTPLLRREKTDFELQTKHHGTEVVVMKLEPDRLRPLIYGAGKTQTKRKLGKIYGHVMTTLGITILYSGDAIKPWRHCVWDQNRSVTTQKFGNVPAIIEINRVFDPRKYCSTCWVWLNPDDRVCPSCGMNDHLIERQRRLNGWIGIQRYFDKEHYGIDLIRNGRVIQELDKSFFWFESPDGEKELEYPIDAIHWGGRIVGEIEIDFVRVTHQKDAFDKLDPEWKHVIETIRGNSPLRPQIAERMRLPVNESPLARLFAGYRSGYAGLNDLVPGDAEGKGLNSGLVMDYKDRFYAGETDFQGDEKLYELVLQAEEAKRGGSTGSRNAGGVPPIEFPQGYVTTSGTEQLPEVSIAPPPEVIFENDPNLSRTYELKIGDIPITVNAQVKRVKNKNEPYPFLVKVNGFNFEFIYVPNHALFEESLDAPIDFFLTELSFRLLTLSTQSSRDWPVSVIERLLRDKYFPETTTSVSKTADVANNLLNELREHLDEELPTKSPIDPSVIDEETKKKIQRQVLQIDLGDQAFVEQTIRGGEFVKYVDNKYLIKIISKWPDLVMDGFFFTNPYSTLDVSLRDEALHMLIYGLEDVLWISEDGRNAMSKDVAWRLHYARALASTNLVLSWRSE